MKMVYEIILKNQDVSYRDFNSKLIPNIDKEKIIGVRIPVLRKIAKDIYMYDFIDDFLKEIPHKYQEENILHGLILVLKYKDIDILLEKLDIFLEYVDNWAVTDVISPKIFKKYPDKVYEKIKIWVNSDKEYKVRFGIVSLLQFYLDKNFHKDILKLVSNIDSNYYYVLMAISWFYSVALVKQYDDMIGYFEKKRLDKWVHNKSIQKAIESYRISNDRKEYLRSLKIK